MKSSSSRDVANGIAGLLPASVNRVSARCHSSVYKYTTLLLVLYVLSIQKMDMAMIPKGGVASTTQTESTTEQALGDGCYHVFLDVGANIGVHGRFLLEPEKYPKSTSSVALFRKEYGSLDNRDVCVFAFEANPKHWPRLKEVSKAYETIGWRFHVIEAAVSDQKGSASFYHQGKHDEQHSEWGFSGAKDLSSVYGEEKSKGKYIEEVPTIRLSEWIENNIHRRIVPKNSKKNDNQPPILGMKMDIEGYEYIVLPDLIHSNVICNFDFVFGEFHPRFAPIERFRESKENFHRVKLDTEGQAHQYGKSLVEVIHGSRNCKIRWIDSDDESYLKDGQPLPKGESAPSKEGGKR